MTAAGQAWLEAILAVVFMIYPMFRGLLLWRRWLSKRYRRRTQPSGNNCR